MRLPEPLKYLAWMSRARWPLVYLAIGTATSAAQRGPRRLLYRYLMSRPDLVVGVSAETLEEVTPKVQQSIITSLDSDRAADIVEEMDPDAAAGPVGVERQAGDGVPPPATGQARGPPVAQGLQLDAPLGR